MKKTILLPGEVIRATKDEKEAQIQTLHNLHKALSNKAEKYLKQVQTAALHNENVFETLMEATKYCSLGQITNVLIEVGGEYGRNM